MPMVSTTIPPGETTKDAPTPDGYEKVYSEITGRYYLRILPSPEEE